MEKNLRELMAAAAEKRLADLKSNSSTNSNVIGDSTQFISDSEKTELQDSEETCLSNSAELFPNSSELFPDSPVIAEQCSSQASVYSEIIESSSSPHSSELFTEDCISEVHSQPENDSQEEQELEFLNRTPRCSLPLPKLEPLENHSIMFSPHIRPGVAPRPYPPSYRDKWDSDHVRMPCSPQNRYPVEDLSGEKQIRNRWDLICLSLRRNIRTSQDLEKAISQYNNQTKVRWNFNGLHSLFSECFTDAERHHFFDNTLPAMIDIALDLPNICTQPIPLLKKNKDHYVTMSQKQVACLLLNAFFCTFPRRNYPPRKHRQQWNSEYSTYPDINFNRLFYGAKNKVTSNTEKLKCIINYFIRITSTEPSGTMTFHRQCLQEFPTWRESKRGIKTALIKADGLIETEGHGMLQVDFANKFVGGGVLGQGCVQEEIRFVLCPELIVSRLFVECLGHNEVLIITGAEQYNKQSGYSSTFKWEGNFQDQTPRDAWGRRYTQIVAMDATHFRDTADQFEIFSIQREINKAFCGFFEDGFPPNLSAVATGNWGCGAFKGDPSLKFVIQLLAASQAGRDLLYFTFGNRNLKKELRDIYDILAEKNLVVGDVWRILENFCKATKIQKESHPKLFSFLQYTFSNKNETVSQDVLDSEITDSDKNAIEKLIEAVEEDSDTDIENNDPS